MFGVVNRLSLSVDRLFSNGAEGLFITSYPLTHDWFIRGLLSLKRDKKLSSKLKRCQIRPFPIHEVRFIREDVVFTVS